MLKPLGDRYVILGIISARGAEGATIGEIRSDYRELMGCEISLFSKSTEFILDYVNQLPGVVMSVLPEGAFVWHMCEQFAAELKQMSIDTLFEIDPALNLSDPDTEANGSFSSFRYSTDSGTGSGGVRMDADTDADVFE